MRLDHTARIGATAVGLATLLTLALSGCASRNGSVAEFCAQVPKTPAVSQLSALVYAGTPAEAADRIDQMATSMRALERAAPRTVRGDVATTANFAQHLATDLRGLPPTSATTTAPGTPVTPPRGSGGSPPPYTFQNGSGVMTYNGEFNPRTNVIYRAFLKYPGALNATADFVSYARDHCGAGVIPTGYDTNTTGGGHTVFGNDPGSILNS